MTWPTTPIPTTNLDAGSDSPAAARADIKTMADQVNSIRAEFGTVDMTTTAPVTGDVITYDGSKWAPAAPSGGGGASSIAVIASTEQYQSLTVPQNTYTTLTTNWSETFDGDNIVTVAGDTFTLPTAGTYLIEFEGQGVAYANWRSTVTNNITSSPEFNLELYNDSDSTTVSRATYVKTALSGLLTGITHVTPFGVPQLKAVVTIAGSKTFKFNYQTFTGNNNTSATISLSYEYPPILKITKLA